MNDQQHYRPRTVQPDPPGETTQQRVARLIAEYGPPPKRISDLVASLRAQVAAREPGRP